MAKQKKLHYDCVNRRVQREAERRDSGMVWGIKKVSVKSKRGFRTRSACTSPSPSLE